MICSLCNEKLDAVDRKKLTVKATTYNLHKNCLRKATHAELVEKGLILPDDKGWWTRI